MKGLPSSCTNAKLQAAFGQFGPVDKAFILFDHANGASRGFGFVEFFHEETVGLALATPVIIDGKVVKCSPAILKQEVKQQPTEIKKSKPFTNNQSTDCVLSPNKTSKEKGKKHNQLKSINLKDEYCPEDEATKESSDSSSFDKNSRENFGSPFAYNGCNGQQDNSYSQEFKLSDSQYSFFQLPYQHHFFPAEGFSQPSLPFMFRSSMPLHNYAAKPRPDGVESNAPVDLVTANVSRGQPAAGDFSTPKSQTKSKKQSYYKMF